MTSETLVGFTDHPRKHVFRNAWAKPLLQILNTDLDKRLVYMGLPGIEALDIKAWIKYLRIVIAYQCLDNEKQEDEAEREFQSLENYLSSCTRNGTLEDYGLYQGYMEQVIMTGLDDLGQEFMQPDHVTIYNLDFCNNLNSPFDVAFPDGSTMKCRKLEAIDKLLEIQNSLDASLQSDKFLMYLTVASNFMERDFSSIKVKEYQEYQRLIKNLKDVPKQARLIKAYSYYYLNQIFHRHGFQAEFLPTMYYEGSKGYRVPETGEWVQTKMLTFTILGSRIKETTPLFVQNLGDYLKCKFLFASNTALSSFTERKIEESDFEADPTVLLKTSFTYNNIWAQS